MPRVTRRHTLLSSHSSGSVKKRRPQQAKLAESVNTTSLKVGSKPQNAHPSLPRQHRSNVLSRKHVEHPGAKSKSVHHSRRRKKRMLQMGLVAGLIVLSLGIIWYAMYGI